MSGTSLDGVDAVLAKFSKSGQPTVLAHASLPYSDEIRSSLLDLQSPGFNELARAASMASRLTRLYADVVYSILERAHTSPADVAAIGCHGQTIRHEPNAGYTIQLANLALLAELTTIDTVGDFRGRDIAAGGQGAPLVPAFHDVVFRDAHAPRVIVNIGGIANLTFLGPNHDRVLGFDVGPGNILLDGWCQRHTAKPYDAEGQWAATGQCCQPLLQALLSDAYFSQSPPKSTGRDYFNLNWLDAHLFNYPKFAPYDVQATLVDLTAQSIACAISHHASSACEIYVCGGGALNTTLFHRLGNLLPTHSLYTTEALGLPVMQVEATAFAWLAYQHIHHRTANLPIVTGARAKRILGALYPA